MESISIQDTLCLYKSLGNIFRVQAAQIILAEQEDDIQVDDLVECRLKFWINWSSYQQIESQSLFNFEDQLQGAMSDGNFLPNLEVEVTTLLRPDLLDELPIPIRNATTITTYLEQLSQEQPTHELLSTDSWILLSAQQQQPQGVVQYRTIWDYLDWGTINADDSEIEIDDWLLKGIANFLKDSILRHLATDPAGDQISSQLIDATTQLLETLFTKTPSLFSDDQGAKEQVIQATSQFFTEALRVQLTDYLAADEELDLEDFLSEAAEEEPEISFSTTSQSIFEQITRFFQTESWAVEQIPNQTILHFYFEGKNSQWECYAQAREAQQQFVFYSILPQKAPESKRQVVAEYLTRANYGIIFGNFELDFDDGEIRYKTSFSGTGYQLTSSLIRDLIYSNIFNTDQYLPGLLKLLDSEISPAEAIKSCS